MTVNYKNSSDVDLDTIFEPHGAETAAAATGFKNVSGTDFNLLYYNVAQGGTSPSAATGFKLSGGADLNTVFAELGTVGGGGGGITILESGTASPSSASAVQTSWSPNITWSATAGSNRLLLIIWGSRAASPPGSNPTFTFDSTTMTLHGSTFYSADGGVSASQYVTYLKESQISGKTSGTKSVSASWGVNQQGHMLGWMLLDGVDQTTPIDSVQSYVQTQFTGNTSGLTATSKADHFAVCSVTASDSGAAPGAATDVNGNMNDLVSIAESGLSNQGHLTIKTDLVPDASETYTYNQSTTVDSFVYTLTLVNPV